MNVHHDNGHAPDCECGCGHEHHEHHDHHKHHEHGPDCKCGCGHGHGEEVVDSTLIISEKGALKLDAPGTAEDALSRLTGALLQIAELVAVEGAVLGHIKALLDCEAGRATVSVTLAGAPGIVRHEGWRGDTRISSAKLSLNILSLANTDAAIGPVLDGLISKES